MADQNAALQQFLSITRVRDAQAAQRVLEAANWNVDVRTPSHSPYINLEVFHIILQPFHRHISRLSPVSDPSSFVSQAAVSFFFDETSGAGGQGSGNASAAPVQQQRQPQPTQAPPKPSTAKCVALFHIFLPALPPSPI
jgi:hypothetical protein